ncbi:hypothetical protein BG57_32295 [Caballeronia grimmiae]|uniref:Uncharacterized protein n=1 Tax=Caballeronia grimmiae TaxID=1071679 RepID=A0A069P3Z5_9BURK|nr:hypothetical protein BG57_32295 [Caballeronia grimmiae]GGD88503.1 hypothetical protein GCM10010985_48830 [Caballeronia grimmiae]
MVQVDQYFLIRRVHSTAEEVLPLCTTFNIINDLVPESARTRRGLSRSPLSNAIVLRWRPPAAVRQAVIGDAAHLNVGFRELRMSLRDPKRSLALSSSGRSNVTIESRRLGTGLVQCGFLRAAPRKFQTAYD